MKLVPRTAEQDLEMFRYLTQKNYEINMQRESISAEDMKKMAGKVGEYVIADLAAGLVVERDGFDVVVLSEVTLSNGITLKPGDRIEVKTQVIQTSGKCTAYSLDSKQTTCEYIALVDMTTTVGNERIFIIPTEMFFAQGHFYGKNEEKERFSWSGSYNESDNQMVSNTKLILEYEVTNA